MKINENQKITLTLGQLKRLVKESSDGRPETIPADTISDDLVDRIAIDAFIEAGGISTERALNDEDFWISVMPTTMRERETNPALIKFYNQFADVLEKKFKREGYDVDVYIESGKIRIITAKH